MIGGVSKPELGSTLLIVAVAASVVVLYAGSFVAIAAQWQHADFRYGALIFPIAAALLWRIKGEVARADFAPWAPGLAVIAALSVTWIVAHSFTIEGAEQLAAVLLIPAAVATVLGLAVVRSALFPLLFLVAAVPFGDGVVPYLMDTTASVSSAMLREIGVPVLREGQFLTLPGGKFEVAEACAGFRYLVSGTVLALLFAYLTYRSNVKRAVFVGAAAVSVVVANCVRAFVVMYVASATQMRYFAGTDHIVFGWLLFGVVLGAGMWVGGHYADEPSEEGASGQPRGSSRAAITQIIVLLSLTILAITALQFRAALGSAVWFVLWAAGVPLIWVLRRSLQEPSSGVGVPEQMAFAAYLNPRGLAIVGLALLAMAIGPLWTTIVPAQ